MGSQYWQSGHSSLLLYHPSSSCLSTLHHLHSPPATPAQEDTLQLPPTLLPTPPLEINGFHLHLEDLIPWRQHTLPELLNSWIGLQYQLELDPLADGIQWQWKIDTNKTFSIYLLNFK